MNLEICSKQGREKNNRTRYGNPWGINLVLGLGSARGRKRLYNCVISNFYRARLSREEKFQLGEVDTLIRSTIRTKPGFALGCYAELPERLKRPLKYTDYWSQLDRLIDQGVQGQI